MLEVFKVLEDFPAYRVSNLGRVQSRWQRIFCYSGFPEEINDKWVDVLAGKHQKGYMQLVLCDGMGKKKTVRVHNLVARYFIGERPKGRIVRHLDSNPRNNKVSNLSYGTYLDNENDKISNGTWNTRYGGAKITPAQVIEIRHKLQQGARHSDLAVDYGVSRPTITRIANSTTWKLL